MAAHSRSRGGPVPKSRAKRRGPRDRHGHEQAPSYDEQTKAFAARIGAWLALEERMERLHALDLRAFLQSCPHPRYGPGERLRRLAIYLDGRVHEDNPMRSWAAIQLHLAGTNADVFHARIKYWPLLIYKRKFR